MHAIISGVGHYLPKKIVKNADLEKKMETSDEWIVSRTGIAQRHIADSTETAVYMSTQAAQEALANANLKPTDINLVLVATSTPDQAFPSTACSVSNQLGIACAPAFDLQAACSGFIYALSVAHQFIQSGTYKNVLVVGVEIMSRLINWDDRATAVLFGDGAGAVIFSASDRPGIINTQLSADGQYGSLLYVSSDLKQIHMSGKEVFKVAVNTLEELVIALLEKAHLKKTDLNWLIPHQANARIINATAKKLNMSPEQVILTVGQHANTSAASVPLALYEGIQSGKVKRGDLLLLEAFGAGFTWGGALIRY